MKMNEINKKQRYVGYIYVRTHPAYEIYDGCKMGKATNIPERDTQYATGELKRGHFELVFEVPIKKVGIIERLLQNEFGELHIKYNGGTEFYKKEIIHLIEPYLVNLKINYKKLTTEEINKLIRTERIKKNFKKNIKSLIKILKSSKSDVCDDESNKKYIWNERDYQSEIIKFSMGNLLSQNKIYIELPTGGGKSYVVYNLFERLKSDFIIILSPRKIVNSQNVSEKYLQILTEKYITFNYSIDNNIDYFLRLFNKKILICCTQSIDKIYEKIISNNINDITIWFDEAHWGVEDWSNNLDNDLNSQFWLLNNTHIKYRIFTSASPNKTIILQNEKVFGPLYSPIKVKDLINLKWLTEIEPYVYSENTINVDNIKYVIKDFNEKNKKYGFSFHNKQKNAFNLFYKHYLLYKNGDTFVKPFLLVSDNFTIETEPKLAEISLDYDYRNIKLYESTIYSIGYVVAKYSMGYDFNKLDFISFTDPKLSIQDIKQCIGRGIRPDQLGKDGSNRDKVLFLSLPVYIDENGENKYEKIIDVLKYLLYDVETPLEKIQFRNRYISSESKGTQPDSNKYLGINDVKSILLNLLEIEKRNVSLSITYEKAKKIISEKNIKSKEDYYQLCDKDIRLSKEPEFIFKKKFTNWIDYLSIERIYYDLETCKNKVDQYLISYHELRNYYLDLYILHDKLCTIDPLFPPSGLWIDYYNVKDLGNIIHVLNKKKRNGVIL